MGVGDWLSKGLAYGRSWWGIRRTLATLTDQVTSIDQRVASLEPISPHPLDADLLHGIWWVRFKKGEPRHPCCPVCAAAGRWVVISGDLIDSGHIYLVCQGCHGGWEITQKQQREGAGT